MANYLTSEDDVVTYLKLVLQDGELAGALGPIARARGMTALAADTGLARESLYRSLSGERPPSSDTLFRVMRSFGFTLSASSSKPNAAPGGGSG